MSGGVALSRLCRPRVLLRRDRPGRGAAAQQRDFGRQSPDQRGHQRSGRGKTRPGLAQAFVEIAAAIDFELERVDAPARRGVAVAASRLINLIKINTHNRDIYVPCP